MQKSKLKLLLIQIREDSVVKQEELESFAKYSDLNINQIDTIDVFKDPYFKVDLNLYDGVFVGGASEASVSEPIKYPFVESIKKLMLECIKIDKPMFASCFGFQAAVLALKGIIIKDTQDFEMGTYPISLTEMAFDDPVFKNIHDQFFAVSVHQEKATSLPDNCQLLAYTEACCHAFKVKDKSFWAFQFHPELDKECLTQRLGIYKDKYTEDREHFEEIIANIQETPESNQLVKNFVDNVLLK
jgi:GMP synthase (glutamine-hydrolysing)